MGQYLTYTHAVFINTVLKLDSVEVFETNISVQFLTNPLYSQPKISLGDCIGGADAVDDIHA